MKVRHTMLFLILIFSLASCNVKNDSLKARNREIKFSYIFGNCIKIAIATTPGSEDEKCARFAVDEINESGGVLGKKLELLVFDDKGTVFDAERVAYQIAENKSILAVIGHEMSALTERTSLIYQFYNVININSCSTSTNLWKRQGFDCLFNAIPSSDSAAKAGVKFYKSMDKNKYLIYHENDPFATTFANSFERQSVAKNAMIVDRAMFTNYYNKTDFSQQVFYWKQNFSFDAVFIASTYPLLIDVIANFANMEIGVPIITDNAIDKVNVPELLNEKKINDVYFVTDIDWASENPMYTKLRKLFDEKYDGKLLPHFLYSYDAVYILAQAIEKAGSVKIEDVKSALHSGEFSGAVRNYSFDECGDVKGAKFYVKKFEDGKILTIEY